MDSKRDSNQNRVGKHRTMAGVAHVLLANARVRAIKHGGTITLTRAWIEERLEKGCAVTGLPFQISFEGGNKNSSPQAPSLDRIDNANRNQTPENCRLVLYQINAARNRQDDATCIHILSRLVPVLEKMASEDASSHDQQCNKSNQ